jgi:hypothetical protein
MLPLDDPRWLNLGHRNWSPGDAPGAGDVPFVPDELRLLLADPRDHERFGDLWPHLCSEDTPWPAAYAAVPYIVAIARDLPPAERDHYLIIVGFIAACSGPYGHVLREVPDDIAADYRRSLPEALALLTEQLATPQSLADIRRIFAAAAALQGHGEFSEFLFDLDLHAECESCGEPLLALPDGVG